MTAFILYLSTGLFKFFTSIDVRQDVKIAYVEAPRERLQEYPPDCTIPFPKHVKQAATDAMNSYAALNLKGFSTSQDKPHYRLRTAAYIYKTICQ